MAAALAARRRRTSEAGLALYLPARDNRFGGMPEAGEAEDVEVDAACITIGGEEDDDNFC
jgi:hypothetical protein